MLKLKELIVVMLGWLNPWEFSPTLIAVFLLTGLLFWRGQSRQKLKLFRRIFFWSGFGLIYFCLHTQLDYYAERLFFVHRIQHLVLHHLGPLLIMAAFPGSVIRAGLPLNKRIYLRDFRHSLGGRALERILTHSIFVPLLFVFLVLVWLAPTVQFYSMLDWRLYRLMNWSVVVSGLMYWNLILDRRLCPPARMLPGARVLSPILTMAPQMLAGAIITFTSRDLYPLFELCGRALPITSQTDQTIGGLTLWIPAALIEWIGLLVALGTWMRLSSKKNNQRL